jgi:hypothetical protein
MSAVTGIDLGALTVKVAVNGRGVHTITAPAGGPAGALRAALSAAGRREVLCVAVPDTWLSGEAAGAAQQETVRHECTEQLEYAQVLWAGQLAAVAAYAAAICGPGRHLICDIGGTGIRAGMFSVSAGTVRVEAVHAEADGGWREFDAEVRAGLPQSPALPANWYEQAAHHNQDHVVKVLEAALGGGKGELAATVYRITGPDGDILLTAGRLIEAFAPTEERLEAAIAAVQGRVPPDHVVLAGGLSQLPLAPRAAGIATDTAPLIADPDAAARGALMFARGDAALVRPGGGGHVAVPVNLVRDGLLEEVDVPLPWSEPFAHFPGGPLMLDREELTVLVAGCAETARLRGLVPGPHLIGARPAWPGLGVLVVRPTAGDGPAHIVSLATLMAR